MEPRPRQNATETRLGTHRLEETLRSSLARTQSIANPRPRPCGNPLGNTVFHFQLVESCKQLPNLGLVTSYRNSELLARELWRSQEVDLTGTECPQSLRRLSPPLHTSVP